jgi:hypothetical protein
MSALSKTLILRIEPSFDDPRKFAAEINILHGNEVRVDQTHRRWIMRDATSAQFAACVVRYHAHPYGVIAWDRGKPRAARRCSKALTCAAGFVAARYTCDLEVFDTSDVPGNRIGQPPFRELHMVEVEMQIKIGMAHCLDRSQCLFGAR